MKSLRLAAVLLCVIATPAWTITVQDFAGRTVTLPQPASRIVALAPNIVENLYSAGAGEKIVGVVSYSNFPDAANTIAQVGTYNAFSIEKIIDLKPDLVVMWGSGNGMQTLSRLQELGLPTYVSELRHLSDIPQSIRNLGALAGTDTVAEAEATRIEQQFELLRTQYSGRTQLSVFYQIWNEPLQTINGEHLISEVIALCGGHNVFGDARSLAPKISIESILLRNPDAIVASGMDEARPEWLDEWRVYTGLAAVKTDALFFIHPDHIQRPTARILLGATRLCQQLDGIR